MVATCLQERVLIQELSQSGMSDLQIARQMGLSVHTVRKWRRKGQAQGMQGLVSQMGRPAQGFLSSFDPQIGATLRAWREAHPGWGAKTLEAELLRSEPLAGRRLPSRRSIACWLNQEDFTRPYDKHQPLPQAAISLAQACHEEWEMDARGYEKVPGVGVVALINLNDVFSRVKLLSYPVWVGDARVCRHANTEDYRLALRLAFVEWGLPDRLAVDHESIFYDNTNKSPYPTVLHLWLLALGVEFTFGRPGVPQDQAITERSHQTWHQQVLQGQVFASQQALWQQLEARKVFLNHCLPCASLGDQPPLVAHPEARLARRVYRPEWEAQLMDLERVYAYLSQGRWFRKASNVGVLKLGQESYWLGQDWQRREVEVTFEAEDRHMVFRAGGEEKRRPVKGITLDKLMGEIGPLVHLNNFQLSLPFTWNEWRQIQSCRLLTGTT
jgi:transposase InsO family protein